MGEEYKKLLCQWGLESLIDRFEDEEISDDVFFLLTDDLIKELIPKIGPRARFAAKYRAYDASNSPILMPMPHRTTSTPKRSRTSGGNATFSSSCDSLTAHTPLPEESAETYSSYSVEVLQVGSSDQYDDKSLVPSAGSCNQFGDGSLDLASDQLSILETNNQYRKRSSEHIAEPRRMPDTKSGGTQLHESSDFLTKFDLNALLETSSSGQLILAVYKKEGMLDNVSRQGLVTIIIAECLHHVNKLVNSQLKLITEKIVLLFPNEHEGTYYVPPLTEGRSQRISKGKLVDKYRKRKQMLMCAGVLPRERNLKCFKREKSPMPESSSNIAEELQDHVAWLRLNTEPWPVVVLHWTATSVLRVGSEADGMGVEDIFDSWPALTQPLGYDLIDIDFEFLYPSQKLVLFWKWPEVVGTITTIMRSQIKDKTSVGLMKLLGPELNPDSELVIILLLVAALCPPVARLRLGNRSWKPSILESQEGMVAHVKFANEIGPLLQAKREKAASMNLTLQPILIVQGPSLSHLEAFYVSINQQLYCLPSMIKALDVCFKAYQVFNATYPPESEQLWTFLQKGIYGIVTKYDRQIASVNNLITRIELKQPSVS